MSLIPKAIGPYASHRKVGDFLFTSGQLPASPVSNEIEATDIAGQTKQSLENMKNVLASENLTMQAVVKTTVYLSDIQNFEGMNEVYKTYFSEPFPARTAIEIAKLPKNALVEIEAVAYCK